MVRGVEGELEDVGRLGGGARPPASAASSLILRASRMSRAVMRVDVVAHQRDRQVRVAQVDVGVVVRLVGDLGDPR